jgi:hypothetical protein
MGLEPSLEHPVSHDSIAITRKGVDGETLLKPSESELPARGGTRVPDFLGENEPLARLRRAWGALRVV